MDFEDGLPDSIIPDDRSNWTTIPVPEGMTGDALLVTFWRAAFWGQASKVAAYLDGARALIRNDPKAFATDRVALFPRDRREIASIGPDVGAVLLAAWLAAADVETRKPGRWSVRVDRRRGGSVAHLGREDVDRQRERIADRRRTPGRQVAPSQDARRRASDEQRRERRREAARRQAERIKADPEALERRRRRQREAKRLKRGRGLDQVEAKPLGR